MQLNLRLNNIYTYINLDFKGVRVLPGRLRDVVHDAEFLLARDGRQPGHSKQGVRRNQRDSQYVRIAVLL